MVGLPSEVGEDCRNAIYKVVGETLSAALTNKTWLWKCRTWLQNLALGWLLVCVWPDLRAHKYLFSAGSCQTCINCIAASCFYSWPVQFAVFCQLVETSELTKLKSLVWVLYFLNSWRQKSFIQHLEFLILWLVSCSCMTALYYAVLMYPVLV